MKPTTVSLFCGAGGESVGKDLAFEELGIKAREITAHAINHWDLAVATHGLNLPAVLVHQDDITKVSAKTYGLKKIDLLWASPSCVHHSRARGGKPCSDQQRSHAWEVLERWLEVARVKVFLMENVAEFMDYGPLDRATQQPIKARKGEYFRAFVRRLRGLGYQVEWKVLCAADFGDPTTRRRFFLQACLDGHPIVWPEPSHRDPRKPARAGDEGLPPWRAAAECIDWSLPCPSIFERKRPLADATLRRIATGVVRYVLNGKPFLVTCNHSDPSFRGQGVDQPIGTITAAHDARGVVVPTVSPFVTTMRGGEDTHVGASARSVDDPLRTVSAGGTHHALVTPFIAGLAHGEHKGKHEPRVAPATEPLRTIHAGGNNHAVVAPVLVNTAYAGTTGRGAYAYDAKDPLRTITAGRSGHALVAPCLVQTSYGERKGQAPRVLDIERPLGTVVAGGQKHGLVAAFLSNHYGGPGALEKQPPGKSPSEPMSTVTAQDKHSMVQVDLDPGKQPADHCKQVAAFILKYYGCKTGQTQSPADPMHTIRTIAHLGLVQVEIEGATYVVTDIGLRMLEPRELALAMGFPAWYRWESVAGKPLTKRDAVKMIGNACPVNTVKALIKAVVLQRPADYGLEAVA